MSIKLCKGILRIIIVLFVPVRHLTHLASPRMWTSVSRAGELYIFTFFFTIPRNHDSVAESIREQAFCARGRKIDSRPGQADDVQNVYIT